MAPGPEPGRLAADIRARARALGFDAVGITPARQSDDAQAGLAQFLAAGWHGDMAWMRDRADQRRDPRALWPQARSVIALGVRYAPGRDPLALLGQPRLGVISAYAQGKDYHDVLKSRMKALARWLAQAHGAQVKVFVDTAPVMEKPLAQAAGLGWQGKHTNLVSRTQGSWLFLGEVMCDLDLAPDQPEADHCGRCRACLDICPTRAFPAPYRLDARRCLAYLTIEHKGHIAAEFRKPMGNRIYGCDDCLAVCPWNKFAAASPDPALLPRIETLAPQLSDLAQLTDAAFRQVFAGSPIKRTGRDRFLRNVLIALGNTGDATLAPVVEPHLADPAAIVRAMAVWALAQLADWAHFGALRARHMDAEPDAAVRLEWQRGREDGSSGPGTGQDQSRPVSPCA